MWVLIVLSEGRIQSREIWYRDTVKGDFIPLHRLFGCARRLFPATLKHLRRRCGSLPGRCALAAPWTSCNTSASCSRLLSGTRRIRWTPWPGLLSSVWKPWIPNSCAASKKELWAWWAGRGRRVIRTGVDIDVICNVLNILYVLDELFMWCIHLPAVSPLFI